MDNLSKDVLALLALELNYPDIVNLCNISKKNRETCNRLWIEKAIKEYRVTKDDIIGNPLSFYYGCKEDRGHNWHFTDPFFYDTLEVTYLGSEDYESFSFYIPGIDIPRGETVYVGYSSVKNKDYGGVENFWVSKTRGRTIEKMVEAIEDDSWEDIRKDKIYNEIINLKPGDKIKKNIPTGDEVKVFIFETLL